MNLYHLTFKSYGQCLSFWQINRQGKNCKPPPPPFFLTHYQTKNFRLFQTERVCRKQFQIDKIGRKLSKQVENTEGKGEIARYQQFLLFPRCFQKTCFPEESKGVIVWEWVKPIYFKLIQKQVLTTKTNLSPFCFLGTMPALAANVWANGNTEIDTHSPESNSRPYDCEAEDLLIDAGA